MDSNRHIIRRECESETCSRRDVQDETPCHPSDRRGPLEQARSSNIELDDDDKSSHHNRRSDRQGVTESLQRILGYLRALESGRARKKPEQDRVTFALQPVEFERLEELLNDDEDPESLGQWYSRRARYDYEAESARYTLRMPSAVHECFTASAVNAVQHAIDGLVERLLSQRGKGRVATAHALRRIFKGGSTTIELHDVGSDASSPDGDTDGDIDRGCGTVTTEPSPIRRSPDASLFHHDAAELPQLVIEVGYSQHGARLDRIADSYINDSQHAIRCVLGFDIPYIPRPGSPGSRPHINQDHSATVSIWRPALLPGGIGVSLCVADALPFRLDDGTASADHLALYLSDILPPVTLETLPKGTGSLTIGIPFALLAEALDNAERCQATIWDSSNRFSAPTTPTKFLKRKRTPSPAPCEELDRLLARQERAESRRNRREDRAWRSPSSNRVMWHDVRRRRSPRLNKMRIKAESDYD